MALPPSSAHDADIDEELLLEETESLLDTLHPLPEPEPPLLPTSVHSQLSVGHELKQQCSTTPPSSTDSSSNASEPSSPSSPLSSASSGRSSRPDPPATSTTPVTRPPARRNLSRERMQSELRELRALVERLENELHRKRHAQRALVSHRAWEGVAMRQRWQRERAEAELRRLKARVAAQDMLAVEMLYKWKRSMANSIAPVSCSSALAVSHLSFSPHDVSVLQSLLADLDGAFVRTHAVFRDAGVSDASSAPVAIATVKPLPFARNNGTSQSFVEGVHIDVYPFDFATQRAVAWHCMKRFQLARTETIAFPLAQQFGSLDVDDNDSTDDSDSDTFAVKQRVERRYDGGRAVLTYLFAMRRYHAASHEVWIWRGVKRSEQYRAELCVEETGWMVLSPLAAHGASVSSSDDGVSTALPLVGTVQRSCTHYETKPLSSSSCLDRMHAVAGQLTSVVVKDDEDVVVELSAMVESAVLDERTQGGSKESTDKAAVV